jgi:polyphosphate kinase 2 (PPK2 family)
VLRQADGTIVDTWREDYPYAARLDRTAYEHHKRLLQVELLKLQYWVRDTGARIVVLFEGRDAAGKGSTIKRFMEHLNPRAARVVALEVPTNRERNQWYFQSYIAHLTKFWFSVTRREQRTRFAIRESTPSGSGS